MIMFFSINIFFTLGTFLLELVLILISQNSLHLKSINIDIILNNLFYTKFQFPIQIQSSYKECERIRIK